MRRDFFHFALSYEVVAEVENLVTLKTELLLALNYPWGTTFSIVDLERVAWADAT